MAEIPVVVFLGDSNMFGLADLADVDDADFLRWSGTASWTANTTVATDISTDSVQMLTIDLPYSTPDESIAILSVPTTTSIVFATAPTAAVDEWCYIEENSTGYGQHLKVTAISTTTVSNDTVTVLDPLTGGAPISAIAADGSVSFLSNTATVDSYNSSTLQVTVTQAVVPVALAAGDWVTVIAGDLASSPVLQSRRIASNDSTTTFTLESALDVNLEAGNGVQFMISGGCNSLSDISSTTTRWSNLRFYADSRTAYDAPSDRSTYLGFAYQSPAYSGLTDWINGIPEATWGIKNRLGETVYAVVESALGATATSNSWTQFAGSPNYSYIWDVNYNDYLPGSPSGLYSALTAKLDAAKALIVAGDDTMKVVGIFSNFGTNDAVYEVKADNYTAAVNSTIDALRSYIADNSMTTLSADEIPFGLTLINATLATRAYKATVNDAMKALAAKPGVFLIDTSGDDFTLKVDDIHLDADGQMAWGKAAAESWGAIWQAYDDGAVDKASAAAICRIALAHIGEKAVITSIDTSVDTSVQAARCARYYEVARDSLLDMHEWNFATKRATPSSLGSPRYEWDYAYALPADCMRVTSVLPPSAGDDYSLAVSRTVFDTWPTPIGNQGTYVPQDFQVERGEHGGLILYTNQATAEIRYRAKVSSTTSYPPLFKEALSWHLAGFLAGETMRGKSGAALAKHCEMMFQHALGKALVSDSNERDVNPVQNVPWITGR